MGLTPATHEEVAAVLADASRTGTRIVPVGGATRSRRGRPAEGATALHTRGLDGIVEHIPAELTVTVGAGTLVTTLGERLAAAGQWWPQADAREGSTVGGVIAAAASGRRRLRYGPVRDSLLQVVLATGDGRIVTGGGRTVKGVAGYDLPRLAVGSLGTLGVILQVTLKLTPLPAARGWFVMHGTLAERRSAARRVLREVWRPAAVLLSAGALWVELAGAPDDVTAPAGFAPSGPPAEPAGTALVDVGVPPASTGDFAAHAEARGLPYLAECGTGACRVAIAAPDLLGDLQGWAGEFGGHATVVDGPDGFRTPPAAPAGAAAEIAGRMRIAFDPARIMSPAHQPETAP